MIKYRLQAGAGRAEIGFTKEDFPLKAFTGIHDKIYVRVLLLEAKDAMALVSVELTSLPPEAIRRFRRECSEAAGVDEKNVFVSVTHMFSGPHIPPHITNEKEQKLSDIMYERLCGAIREASKKARDSVAESTVGYCETSCCLNVNRNIATKEGYWIGKNEDGFSDHTVRVLKFYREGELFAYLINYDIQSSVMDKSEARDGGRLISGDLVGAACKELEQKQPVTAIFVPGCAGDQAPVAGAVQINADGIPEDIHEDGFVLVKQLGRYLADRVYGAGETVSHGTDEGVREAELEIESVMAELPEQEMKYATKELRPHRQYSFELTGRSIQVPITLIRLDFIQILFTTPELNSGFGSKIRDILGRNLLIGTLVNGAVKYLPEEEDFKHITYEAMNSKLGIGSDGKFLEAVEKLKK